MKKFILVLPLMILFSACTVGKTTTATVSQDTSSTQQTESEMKELAAAIQAGKAVRCTMTKKDDGMTMEYMMKGKKMKMMGMKTAQTTKASNLLSDAMYMYTWSEGEAKGVKMKLPNEEEIKELADKKLQQANTQQVPDFSQEEARKKYEDLGFSIDCKTADVADSEFVPPTTVEFIDMSVSMEKMQQLMKKDSQATTATDQEAAKKQAEEFMKQMGQ